VLERCGAVAAKVRNVDAQALTGERLDGGVEGVRLVGEAVQQDDGVLAGLGAVGEVLDVENRSSDLDGLYSLLVVPRLGGVA
jgi:hypothetical protein